jgi:hypothetical protein
MVFFVMASRIAATSARQLASIGTLTRRMPKYCAALSNAVCAVSAATISGSVMPRRSRAWSR